MNNFEEEYNKLFNYFLNRIENKNKVKTVDDLIEEFENYYCINHLDYCDSFSDYHDYTIKTLDNFTELVDSIKNQLNELKDFLTDDNKEKIDTLIENFIEKRKMIYASENDKPPEILNPILIVETDTTISDYKYDEDDFPF